MITLSKSRLAFVCLACLVAGWWLTSSPSSPIGPTPQRERPVLKAIARIAKGLLWVSLFVERAPEEPQRYAHARLDAMGQPVIDHARGW